MNPSEVLQAYHFKLLIMLMIYTFELTKTILTESSSQNSCKSFSKDC